MEGLKKLRKKRMGTAYIVDRELVSRNVDEQRRMKKV
jgi:hypothetical protein